jgi:hypothetical protein
VRRREKGCIAIARRVKDQIYEDLACKRKESKKVKEGGLINEYEKV